MKSKKAAAAIGALLIIIGIAAGLFFLNSGSVPKQVREQLELGQRYLSEMKYEEAIVAFHKVIELDPKNTEAYVSLADAYAANGQLDMALEVLQNAPEDVDDPDNIIEKMQEIQQLAEERKSGIEEETAAEETTEEEIKETTAEETAEETTAEEVTTEEETAEAETTEAETTEEETTEAETTEAETSEAETTEAETTETETTEADTTETDTTETPEAETMAAAEPTEPVNGIPAPNGALEWNGHYYMVYSDAMEWSEADLYCQESGGHLLTINSAEEQSFIESIISDQECNLYWIGLYRDENHEWVWVDGEPLSYSNWGYAEPNEDFNGRENVVQIYGRDESNFSMGEWNDSLESGGTMEFWRLDHTGFICEWE